MDPREEKKANRLCVWSLVLNLSVFVLGYIVPKIVEILCLKENELLHEGPFSDVFTLLESTGSIQAFLIRLFLESLWLASIVLVIIVRVKYPRNTFGKVLMWIYIVLFVAALIFLLAVLVTCGIMLGELVNSCQSCG